MQLALAVSIPEPRTRPAAPRAVPRPQPGRDGRLVVSFDEPTRLTVEVGDEVPGPEARGPLATAVVVDADPDTPIREVAAAIAAQIGVAEPRRLAVLRTGGLLDLEDTLGVLDVRNGDTIVFDGPTLPASRHAATPLDLVVISGVLAGTRRPLAPGRHVIGRDPIALLQPIDEAVSRRHCLLDVTVDGIEVHDAGSTNGTFVDGHRVEEPTRVTPGEVIAVGDTRFTVISAPVASEAACAAPIGGRVPFNRPPRVTRPREPATVKLPTPPAIPRKPRLPLVTCLVPLLMAPLLYVMTQQVMFLLFMLMSPVMAIFSYVDDRRRGGRTYTKDVASFETALATAADAAAAAHHAEVLARRAEAPIPAELVARVDALATDLWERRPGDADFLALRSGTGDLPADLVLVADDPRGEIEERFREGLERIERAHATDPDVPVVVELGTHGVIGIAGEHDAARSLLRALVVDAVTHQSPRDLAVVGLVPGETVDGWDWLRWLPHTEHFVAPVAGARAVASEPEETRALLQMVEDLLEARKGDADRRARAPGEYLPQVLLVIPGAVPVSQATLAKVLHDGPAFGIRAVVLAERRERLPGACRVVADLGSGTADGTLTITTTGETYDPVHFDGLTTEAARAVAHRLAGVRDVTARGAAGDLPTHASLLDLLGLSEPEAAGVVARWQRGIPGLGAPVAMGATGPFGLDLRRDGPHALVAGTTGAGKSELLQTLVVSLAASHRPERLAFVLIDYKGGAAFTHCTALPHTVGFFTDLDPHLARRALVSLEAELRQREHVLREGGARDLIDLESRNPTLAPPNLVIVIDEFAFLKREVPEFVDGLVDIAQRGRSLGVHLVLATQRPTGVIDDNIRANTNLRIALRMADDDESGSVIGRPDSARIPKTFPGRAFVRTGHAEIEQVQTAYVGGPHRGAAIGEVRVVPFRFGLGSQVTTERTPDAPDAATDLQVLVGAIGAAARELHVPEPRPPWLEPLQGCYPLGALPAASAGLSATLGMADEPAAQRQRPWTLDLAGEGHLLVYGTAGSGKTTALRTLACALASGRNTSDVQIYAIDAASRALRSIEALPHCGAVVPVDEIERVEQLCTMVESAMVERRERLGAVGAGSLAEYRDRTGEALPYLVLMLDGWSSFRATFEDVDHGAMLDRVQQIVTDGRALGVHVVVTSERRSGVPSSLTGAVPARLVLRLADDDEYAWLGVPAAKGANLPAGRAFFGDGLEVQVAVVGAQPSGDAQTDAVIDLGARFAEAGAGEPAPPVRTLPAEVLRSELPAADGELAAVVGLDAGLRPAVVDLGEPPLFLVAGPAGSGRSTALVAVAAALVPKVEAYLLRPRTSPLEHLSGWREVATTREACAGLAARLAEVVRERSTSGDRSPLLVVIDDGDELAEGAVATALETLVRVGRDVGMMLAIGAQSFALHRQYTGWLRLARESRQGLLLMPDPDVDGELFATRLPRRTSHVFPPGRGFLIRRGAVTLVQVAS